MTGKIKVTDIETGEADTYDLSRSNWRNARACMRNGLVIMWVPPELPNAAGSAVRTSGRRWEVIEPE